MKTTTPRVRQTRAVEPLVTAQEAADFLGKPISWIYNRAHLENLPRFKVGTQLRFRLSELSEWVETTRVGGVR